MLDIYEELCTLSKERIFATLDLFNGYLLIPLSEQAKENNVFITDKIAQFERIPFELKTTPAAFWKLMNMVFKELKRKGIIRYYLDDIIVIA